MFKNILILGANSDIAMAIAGSLLREEAEGLSCLHLASKNTNVLKKRVEDMRIKGISVEKVQVHLFDALDFSTHASFFDGLSPRPDCVIAAFGYLGDQIRAQASFEEARRVIDVNFAGAVSILEIVADYFGKKGEGMIVGISSVAGVRGRKANYIYGAAKAGMSAYLSGLRNRLYEKNVHVITVLPGFVATKMTAHLDLPPLLTATPQDAAKDIITAMKKKKNIIYTKGIWRLIMCIIRHIPENIFKKLNL